MPSKARFGARRILAAGFALIILCGALLLMLPPASRNGESIPFLNALFTATSATCVTGLVVYDTWTQFSLFGQVIILLLVQIGGLGFMTFTILFSMALGKRVGLKERGYLMEAVSAFQLGGVVRLAKHILLGTLFFESLGAILLFSRFWQRFGLTGGIWFAIFHSVSAFCNAGFDLMGSIRPFASFTPFANDPLVNLTLIGLIIIGGIGFVIWDDLLKNRWHYGSYLLHTKVTLVSTGLVLCVSAALFYFLEKDVSFAGLSGGGKLLAALFQAVTPRTAGFNTVDTAALSQGGSLLTMLLMAIGAAPGSTGGGIKITTFVVILSAVWANLQRRDDVEIFHRRLETSQIKRAFLSAAFYFILLSSACLLILATQNLTLKDALFETFSAIGTVGLSMGITRELLPFSKLVIILLMYAGRVGSLTIFLAATEHRSVSPLRSPEGKIIVG
ncbi:MAG: TrkH family potassium uptake protein [Negativicutes bacterium]|nr:TrkH family potassium uptake protein [Negativicutes bacterium]